MVTPSYRLPAIERAKYRACVETRSEKAMQLEVSTREQLAEVLRQRPPEFAVVGPLALDVRSRLRMRRFGAWVSLCIGAVAFTTIPISGGLSAGLVGLTAAGSNLTMGLAAVGVIGALGWRAVSVGYEEIEVCLDPPRVVLRKRKGNGGDS
jgi:hypothetical protein